MIILLVLLFVILMADETLKFVSQSFLKTSVEFFFREPHICPFVTDTLRYVSDCLSPDVLPFCC